MDAVSYSTGFAGIDNAVAPVYPSGPIAQILSPDILVGKAKYMKARAVNAGLKMFVPTPPKISFPIIIPNAVPIKTCHKGTSGGIVKGINAQVTRNPSFTSCLRITEKVSSQIAPDMKVMINIGNTYDIPKIKFSNIDLDTSVAIAFR